MIGSWPTHAEKREEKDTFVVKDLVVSSLMLALQRAAPTIATFLSTVSLTKGGGPYVEPLLNNAFPIE